MIDKAAESPRKRLSVHFVTRALSARRGGRCDRFRSNSRLISHVSARSRNRRSVVGMRRSDRCPRVLRRACRSSRKCRPIATDKSRPDSSAIVHRRVSFGRGGQISQMSSDGTRERSERKRETFHFAIINEFHFNGFEFLSYTR